MSNDTTFSDLGIPFPLFEAPVRFASSYDGKGCCDLCLTEDVHVFRLGIGDEITSPCVGCQEPLAFSADEPAPLTCSSCGATSPFPIGEQDDIRACYRCVRDGRAAFTQDTEFGMVRPEDAARGLTHGVPGLDAPSYETIQDEEGWSQVKVSSDRLTDLVRTPGFTSWQGERWLFCCGGPMAYVGEWMQDDFSLNAEGGDGRTLFAAMCAGSEWSGWTWDGLPTAFGVIYTFRCQACGDRRAYWDCD